MNYLDCSNYKTTLDSISDILDLDKKYIIRKIKNNQEVELIRNFNRQDYFCCFFHATRIFLNQEFKDGLKPLGQTIDFIWENLGSLITLDKKDWVNFRKRMDSFYYKDCHYNELYHMKITDKFHHGPYGFLIKDVIDNPDGPNNVDYFNTPEIVEDICLTYQEYYEFNLLKEYHKISVPAIIKFRHKNNELCYIKGAINYLRKCILELDDFYLSDKLFSGRGKVINENDILEVERIKNWKKKKY
jgi:hypothetical protein